MTYILDTGKGISAECDNEICINANITIDGYTFFVTYASKDEDEEWFDLRMEGQGLWHLIAFDKDSKLILTWSNLEDKEPSLMKELNERKDFLAKLYTAIRNLSPHRVRMLHLLGPIKQYEGIALKQGENSK